MRSIPNSKAFLITLGKNINNDLTAIESYFDDQIPESDNLHQTIIHEMTKIIKKN